LEGKQHAGFALIRAKVEELQQKEAAARAAPAPRRCVHQSPDTRPPNRYDHFHSTIIFFAYERPFVFASNGKLAVGVLTCALNIRLGSLSVFCLARPHSQHDL
jgi:hypothetical protein